MASTPDPARIGESVAVCQDGGMRWTVPLTCVCLGLLPTVATAIEPTRPAQATQLATLSVSRLLASVLELGYGRDLGGGWSGSALVALGLQDDGNGTTANTYGGGVQGMRRILGTFSRGIHLGLEARYEWRGSQADVPDPNSFFGTAPQPFQASSHGLEGGAFGLARWTYSTGIVVQGAAGVRWLSTWTHTTTDSSSFRERTDGFHPLGHLAVGYAW
jgi:hypothetical protein